MARKPNDQDTGDERPPKSEINFDKECDSICKDLKLEALNIQRDSFITNSISSGSLVMDLVIGGGWPGGKFNLMVGPEMGGKSTFSFLAMKEAMEMGTFVYHFDYEGAADPTLLGRLGLKTDWTKERKEKKPMLYKNFQPDTGEQAFNFMHRLLKAIPDYKHGSGDIIPVMFVLDSLPSMLPEAISEDDEAGGMAIQARMFSNELKKVKTLLARKNCMLFATNQIRDKPGPSYGSPQYEMCGNAPKQYSDLRVKIYNKSGEPGEKMWKGPMATEDCWDGNGTDRYRWSVFTTLKNKVFSGFRGARTRFWFEHQGAPMGGVDPVYDVFEYLCMTGQIHVGRASKGKIPYHILVNGSPFKEKLLNWDGLKDMVLNPAHKANPSQHITFLCRQQLETGEGFKLYFNALGDVAPTAADTFASGAGVVAPGDDGDDEPEVEDEPQDIGDEP